MKPYFSIDLETTGLDHQNHQILEIGIIYEDPTKQLSFEEIPKFHCYVDYGDNYIGSPYALSLNKGIFDMIAKLQKSDPDNLLWDIDTALDRACRFIDTRMVVDKIDTCRITGKNYGSFDNNFLAKNKFHSRIARKVSHRFLEIGSFFFDAKTMDWIPSSEECYRLANIDKEFVSHTALEDAWDVIKIIRTKY